MRAHDIEATPPGLDSGWVYSSAALEYFAVSLVAYGIATLAIYLIGSVLAGWPALLVYAGAYAASLVVTPFAFGLRYRLRPVLLLASPVLALGAYWVIELGASLLQYGNLEAGQLLASVLVFGIGIFGYTAALLGLVVDSVLVAVRALHRQRAGETGRIAARWIAVVIGTCAAGLLVFAMQTTGEDPIVLLIIPAIAGYACLTAAIMAAVGAVDHAGERHRRRPTHGTSQST